MPFDLDTISVFMLVLCRVGALMLTAPYFSERAIPTRAKLGFALVLTLVVMPAVPIGSLVVPTSAAASVVLIFREVLIGIIIGYAAQTVFAGILLAGQVASFQMGLALARAFDPSSGTQSTVVATFYRWAGLATFLVIDGHHHLIRGVAGSYRTVGIGQATFDGTALQIVMDLLGNLFRIAIQVAAPAVVVLFITQSVLALMNRAIPQMHVFLVGLPLMLTLGFLTMAFSIGSLIHFYPILFSRLYESVNLLTRALGS